MNHKVKFTDLNESLEGDLYDDVLHRIIYSTDASAYREEPLAVVYPKNSDDIKKVIDFANINHVSIIPRAAGTSLAGQVVGKGIVLDISKYMKQILELNVEEKWVKVQPGVVLDELNIYLKPFGLFFGPETSTANRCCLGGMVGNNSCGSHSLVYGSTRDHLLETKLFLSDGSNIVFKQLNNNEFQNKLIGSSLENGIYRKIDSILKRDNWNELVYNNFADKRLKRRNSAYALDELDINNINLSKLFAGSEGTLGIATELKLSLVDLPPKEKALVCVHCNSLEEAFNVNLICLNHSPVAVELMDNNILDLSAKNIEQSHNRFFIHGEPAAILMVELAFESLDKLNVVSEELELDLKNNGFDLYCSKVYGDDISKVWALRKSGLGLLSSMPGSAKPVSVIEDTAVCPQLLPMYMKDFALMLKKYNLSCVYHAHIGTGELHLRPIIDLKKKEERDLFREIAKETAYLVKKYKGSLSGEHGDGRLRGEFIPFMFGEEVYQIMRDLKYTFDPKNIFNPNKIIDTPPMNTSLRYDEGYNDINIDTYFDFSKQKGWLSAIEQCNGSGDCRKSSVFGATMCPSYRATGDEVNTTRARANLLRELISRPRSTKKFSQKEIITALDLCVSCKACKSECPSNVDMTRLKAEFMQHYYDENNVGFRVMMISLLPKIQAFFSEIFPSLYNFVVNNNYSSLLLKKVLRFSPKRSLPSLSKVTLRAWAKKESKKIYADPKINFKGKLYLFADEFTNYMESEIGIKFILLMSRLGYEVIVPNHLESGRTYLSKGLLKKAKKIANKNVYLLRDIITKETPLVGIEPSCILSFRDEYPDLVDSNMKNDAIYLSKRSFLFDEYILKEIKKGNISNSDFTESEKVIFLHGHCHQKSLASVEASSKILSLPINYRVHTIPSGCCGMAGAFGYEKEHYELSMKIGEEVLFPNIRRTKNSDIIVAPGTSCRQQIKDGTGRIAYHPIEVLYKALK